MTPRQARLWLEAEELNREADELMRLNPVMLRKAATQKRLQAIRLKQQARETV